MVQNSCCAVHLFRAGGYGVRCARNSITVSLPHRTPGAALSSAWRITGMGSLSLLIIEECRSGTIHPYEFGGGGQNTPAVAWGSLERPH